MKPAKVLLILTILFFFMTASAIAQGLVEVTVDSKVEFVYQTDQTKEFMKLKAEGDFPPKWIGFDPQTDEVHIHFSTGIAGADVPCWYIPKGSLERIGNTFRPNSTNPKESGIQFLEDGQTPAPIQLEFVDFRLRITGDDPSSFAISMRAEGAGSPVGIREPCWWIPAASNIITIEIGNEKGSAIRNSAVSDYEPGIPN